MKNLFKLLAVGALALSFAGCGGSSTTEETAKEETPTATAETSSDQTSEKSPELTGDTEKDYQNAVEYYSKKFKEDGEKVTADFDKETENFDGTKSELTNIYMEYSGKLFGDISSAGMKLEAIFAKDENQDEDLKNKYSSELDSAYEESVQSLYASYMNRLADAKEDSEE